MGYQSGELDALTKAIAQGALSVEYGDKKVTYRSLDDMLRLKKIMEGEINTSTAKSTRRYAEQSKGL